MTYSTIVNRFKEIVTDHNQLQDFGYGSLSDIKTRSEGGTTTNTDYPYLFVNPTSHSRSQQAVTYNFNIIVMDVALDDNFLKIQSECQQYIDDVLARLRFHYKDQVDINLSNISLTPFKERFQDTVAGMTATISIEIPLRLNECIAPFEVEPISIEVTSTPADNEGCDNGTVTFTISGGYLPQVLEYNGNTYNITNPVGTTIQTTNETEGIRPWTLTEDNGTIHTGNIEVTCTYVPPVIDCLKVVDVATDVDRGFRPDEEQSPINCRIINLTDGGWRENGSGGSNFYIPPTLDTITWNVTGRIRVDVVNPGDVFNPFSIADTSDGTIYPPTNIIGWPETTPPAGTEFDFELEFEGIVPNNTSDFQMVLAYDTPDPQAHFTLFAGANITICRENVESAWIQGLKFTQPSARNFAATNAAFNFDDKIISGDYFTNPSFGQWSTVFFNTLPAQAQFTGTFTDYRTEFNPSEWKLGIFRAGTEFIAISNETFPTEGQEITFTFDQFDYTPTLSNYYLTIYKVGSPIVGVPSNELTNPFDYQGQLKLELLLS